MHQITHLADFRQHQFASETETAGADQADPSITVPTAFRLITLSLTNSSLLHNFRSNSGRYHHSRFNLAALSSICPHLPNADVVVDKQVTHLSQASDTQVHRVLPHIYQIPRPHRHRQRQTRRYSHLCTVCNCQYNRHHKPHQFKSAPRRLP
jgi:hypothetical protein